VTVPAGVTAITDAAITANYINDHSNPTGLALSVKAVESATPDAWTTTSPMAVSNWTEASLSANGANAALDLDVTNVVEELVVTNDYDYSSGAYMNFGILGVSWDTSGYWTVANDYGGGSDVAQLSITYTAGGGTPFMTAQLQLRS